MNLENVDKEKHVYNAWQKYKTYVNFCDKLPVIVFAYQNVFCGVDGAEGPPCALTPSEDASQ